MKSALLLCLLMLVSLPSLAQSDCGNGLPCGVVPWQLPVYPTLESPTPIFTPISVITATPNLTVTATSTPSPTLTPSITPTGTQSGQGFFDDFVLTLEAQGSATPFEIEINGTPVSDLGADVIEENSEFFFSYMKGFLGGNWAGPFTPLLQLAGFMIGFIIFMLLKSILTFSLAMLLKLLGALKNFILDFIPGLG